MTLPLAMILFGSLLVYAGWTGDPVRKLIAGGSVAPAKPPAGPRGPIPPSGVIPGTGASSSSPTLMDGVLV